eukprot:jgi/Chrzof1/2870/Cz12g02080.t1
MGRDTIIVIDNGAGNVKLGFGGKDVPQLVFPNCTAKPKGDRQVYVGDMMLNCKDIMSMTVRRPFDRGFLVNWGLERDIWAHALKASLRVDCSETGLVMTEPVFNFPQIQAATEEVVFEEFGFNSFFTAPAPWFSLRHACGPQHPPSQHDTAAAAIAATSGIVVDAGFSACNVVPFFDGKLLAGGVRRLNLGGKALSNLLKEVVSYRSLNMMEEAVLMENVKEALCWVSQDPKYDLKLAAQGKRSPHIREYVLPDGVHNLRGYVRTTTTTDAAAAVAADKAADGASAVGEDDAAGAQNGSRSARSREQAGQAPGSASAPAASAQDQVLTLNNELFMVPEALFRPSDIGLQQAGIHEAVAQAVAGCHPALAPMLFSHIILTGGCSQLPGFAERFRAELRPLVPDDYELGVVMPQEPALYAWQGASAFAASPDYAALATTKEQYAEQGAGNSRR